jgi:hypothetical protein
MGVKIMPRYPTIKVDGVDISDYVRSYVLSQKVGEIPILTVELVLPDPQELLADPVVTDDARVVIGAETRAALIALGWRPPDPR